MCIATSWMLNWTGKVICIECRSVGRMTLARPIGDTCNVQPEEHMGASFSWETGRGLSTTGFSQTSWWSAEALQSLWQPDGIQYQHSSPSSLRYHHRLINISCDCEAALINHPHHPQDTTVSRGPTASATWPPRRTEVSQINCMQPIYSIRVSWSELNECLSVLRPA